MALQEFLIIGITEVELSCEDCKNRTDRILVMGPAGCGNGIDRGDTRKAVLSRVGKQDFGKRREFLEEGGYDAEKKLGRGMYVEKTKQQRALSNSLQNLMEESLTTTSPRETGTEGEYWYWERGWGV